ncbi:MAG TPA: MogA/MoaB family molybdenum cofactor biosynthesis protein [Methanothermococcus okinawensis]|uniref:MogA/MoaB family molybdenum cofactor biosynthesis protein n=1 Tax=Methanothermococcus okinawensis TaxID=155863 RepID=A0A833E1R4_9EURY|nr:MogA/MoaB family molybdenum cofactor biosynthesis protein [Methanococcaceae archaeon]HIP84426.1 MogA/MoaB family molybdenum cofactor biosynthesis protein [Methanothermococcus okinawensis]HIP90770.1 MogA/MoaB family molybdenum cofactor biosynthesis protein [Methanothermococcus okinawensis]
MHRKIENIVYGVITVSDSRFNKVISGEDVEDRSGSFLREELNAPYYLLIPDNRDMIKGAIDHLIDFTDVECIVITGGTGVSPRDNTPDVLREMFHKELTGFSVLFHMLSYKEIKYATLLSRATAGIYRGKVIYALPGSLNACKTALPIIKEETGHILKHIRE